MSTILDLKNFLAFFRLSLLMLANTNCFHTRFSMTFLSCARRIKDKKKRRGFHGKLFHRLANTFASSSLFAARFASPLTFFTFNLSVAYFRANMPALGTIESIFLLFILTNMSFMTTNKSEKKLQICQCIEML